VALSADGRVALIGAEAKDGIKGAAYVFSRHGKRYRQQKLREAVGAADDRFGVSVSLSDSGDIALIGARGKDGNKGAAYVFALRGKRYKRQQELQASDSAGVDYFGISVSLSDSGDVALIGAVLKDNYRGAAYAFAR
jgi:hypothetical protein